MTKLKPCPFCGSEDIELNQLEGHAGFTSSAIFCNDCLAIVIKQDSIGSEVDEYLIHTWNKRP